MNGKRHFYGMMIIDGVYYWVTRCVDHNYCSMTERKTGIQVMESLECYAKYRQIYSNGHEEEKQISLFDLEQ